MRACSRTLHAAARRSAAWAPTGMAAAVVGASATASRTLSTTASASLAALATTLPMMETVQFSDKNMKWSFSDLKNHSDAFAAGLVETGWGPGDAFAVWLPDESPEKLVARFAAARIGLLLVDVDISISDPAQLRQILVEHSCRGILYAPTAGDQYNTDILSEALPELATYDDSFGVPFRSRLVPSLKQIIHTDMDLIPGVANFKHMLARDPMESLFPAPPKPDLPLSVMYGAGGSKGATKTQKDVVDDDQIWPSVSAVLAKQHTVV